MTDSSASKPRSAVQAIKGTHDILPGEVEWFQHLERTARELFGRYGYGEIRTPIIEPTELFARGMGDASEIVVSKQMYVFDDPGGRSNCLRPEGTAGCVRALIESGALKEAGQNKIFYTGPMFRYERPQKGRQRQFHQIGVESFGTAHAAADAEVILLSYRFLRALGFQNVTVKINNLGDRDTRGAYNDRLRAAMTEVVEAATERDAEGNGAWIRQWTDLIALNPMRVFDTKIEAARPHLKTLPRVSNYVSEDAARHYDTVKHLLQDAGVPFEEDPELVRGLDYYTRTVFEIVQGGLGAQNAVLGGGRYDHLITDLGGPATPAVGMGAGVERLILAMQAQNLAVPAAARPQYYMLALDEESLPLVFALTLKARDAGAMVVFDNQPRSPKSGLRAANKSGAPAAILVGKDELARGVVQWKNLESGEQLELSLADAERNLAS